MMKPTLRLLGMVALVTMLSACHRGHDVTFDGYSISLHAANVPTATITSRGNFSIGPKLIDTTPTQRHLLLRYYNRVTAIHNRDRKDHEHAAQLCHKVQQVQTLQATLLIKIPAFKPYAGINPIPDAHC